MYWERGQIKLLSSRKTQAEGFHEKLIIRGEAGKKWWWWDAQEGTRLSTLN